ncbi:unnamed protein product [Gongylonema pulchrum]|uniref:Uncharacterized protein n=1 Tax=Gongylonema pulchrum TaxID=637853 RepID=A0A3P7NNX9_9BILA|nr:unnamed protein product [Gongylonema pulchrum]VDN44834.1 unnamed protein product [Gongylonema pulchrum]
MLWSVSLLLISFQKLFEFIIFRRLMKMFELQRCNAHFCANDVSKAFSTQNDTDDEVNL